MRSSKMIRRSVSITLLALVANATPSVAFGPAVIVIDTESGDSMSVTDIATRGGALAVTIDARIGGQRVAILSSSSDHGAHWSNIPVFDVGTRESQATVCAGYTVMIYTSADLGPATEWSAQTLAVPVAAGSLAQRGWSHGGVVRSPDIACVANHHVVAAWFLRTDSGFDVRVKTADAASEDSPTRQSFDLGSGTRSRGLAVAASADRVYVSWFQGNKLKLRRFAIGGAPNHALSSLGTTTIFERPYTSMPELDADGSLAVLAYMDRADLRVRRSTDGGASFEGAHILRDEPFPSEIGTFPTTVDVHGSRVAIGALEIGGIDGPVGEGIGYRSTNSGSSYSHVSTRSQGKVVAGLLTIGGVFKYAEAWDQSISQPDSQLVRFRRQ